MSDFALFIIGFISLSFWIGFSLGNISNPIEGISRTYQVVKFLSGLSFIFCLLWAFAYNMEEWRYKDKEVCEVYIRDNIAYTTYMQERINLNTLTGKNYQEGDKLTLKTRVTGPYVGLYSKEEKVIVE